MKARMLNLFVEVTHTDQSDLNTGIQRVVRNVLRQLMQVGPAIGVNVYPVVFAKRRFVTIQADDVLRNRASELWAPAVELGQKINFAEEERPRRYLVSGWGLPEPWGTWSVGKRSVLRFRLEPRSARPRFLHVNFGAYCCPELPEQEVAVLINGAPSGRFRFSWNDRKGAARYEAIRIPEDNWERSTGVVEVEFLTPNATSPTDLGLSADERALGIKLLGLELSMSSQVQPPASGMDGHVDVSSSAGIRSIDVADLVAPQAEQQNVLLLLDSSWAYDIWPTVKELKGRGMRVVSVIYDLIPITHPHTCVAPLVSQFRNWMQGQARNADAVICISNYVAETVRRYLVSCGADREVPVGWFHLGAELDFASSADGPSRRVQEIVHASQPVFLMVGTIEPRKNHRQVFAAFDSAWRRGLKAQLVIVGARAWKTEELLAEMQSHPECGVRLHLVRDASDVDLDFLYRRAIALVTASEVEGFGLPIVEARQRGLKVVASDIPVFRELEDPATSFFALGDVEGLVGRLFEVVRAGKETSQVDGSRWTTWRESTEELLSRVQDLLNRLPAAARGQQAGVFKLSRLLVRLRAWSRRSRVIVAGEGSVPTDPYDPGYALLTLQAKRLALARLVGELQAGPPRRWLKIAFCILMRYFDLRLSVLLANALIAERNLARMSAEMRVGSSETGRRKA